MKKTKLIFVTGDKGGVGKTTTSRLLTSYLTDKDVPLMLFDTDKTNATFKRFFGEKVNLLDLSKNGSLDGLINEACIVDQGTNLIVDCAARSLDVILDWMDEVSFEEVVTDHNLDVVFLFVLGGDKDSLQILSDLRDDINSFNMKAQFIVIKNLGRSSDFSQFENSKTYKKLSSDGSFVLELPLLLERTVALIDKENLPFSDVKNSELSVVDKQRALSFYRKFINSFDGTSLWT
jgi:hypothetical protein